MSDLIQLRVGARVDRAIRQLRQFQNLEAVAGVVGKHSARILEVLKGRTPVSKDQDSPTRGDLRKGWYYGIKLGSPRKGMIQATFGNMDPRAKDLLGWLVRGTRAHTIHPARARVLKFKARSGDTVFSASVRHPGTRPYPGLGMELNREVSRNLNAMLREVRAGIAARMEQTR